MIFLGSKDEGLSILDIKPKFGSKDSYMGSLYNEIETLLEASGKTKEEVYDYIENSQVYNEEIEAIYSKLHKYNSLAISTKA